MQAAVMYERDAPLVIGHTIRVETVPPPMSPYAGWLGGIVIVLVTVVGSVLVTVVGLSWWWES